MNTFDLAIPQEENKTPKEKEKLKKERIENLKNSIRTQYNEIYKSQDLEITNQNQKEIEDLVYATQDLIDNCINDDYYYGNKDEKFISLIYICHKIDLKLESYKISIKMKELNAISNDISERQKELEDKNNNLVYNLLGFLASFSIVSAAVAAIENVTGTLNILLVITFSVFLLLTTLIALHNFYKKR